MEFNFEEYKAYDFVINGRKISTLEDCKEWISHQYLLTDWKKLLLENYPYELINKCESQALDLHLFLFLKGLLPC